MRHFRIGQKVFCWGCGSESYKCVCTIELINGEEKDAFGNRSFEITARLPDGETHKFLNGQVYIIDDILTERTGKLICFDHLKGCHPFFTKDYVLPFGVDGEDAFDYDEIVAKFGLQ